MALGDRKKPALHDTTPPKDMPIHPAPPIDSGLHGGYDNGHLRCCTVFEREKLLGRSTCGRACSLQQCRECCMLEREMMFMLPKSERPLASQRMIANPILLPPRYVYALLVKVVFPQTITHHKIPRKFLPKLLIRKSSVLSQLPRSFTTAVTMSLQTWRSSLKVKFSKMRMRMQITSRLLLWPVDRLQLPKNRQSRNPPCGMEIEFL